MPIVVLEGYFGMTFIETPKRNAVYNERSLADITDRGELAVVPHPGCDTTMRNRYDNRDDVRRIPKATTVFYVDYGYSISMSDALYHVKEEGLKWEERRIGRNPGEWVSSKYPNFIPRW